MATAEAPASIMRAMSSPDCAPLMPISGLSRPMSARVSASHWQVSGRFQKPPMPSVVPSIGSKVSTSGINPSRRPAMTTESRTGRERSAGEIGHALALAGELDP